MRDVLTVMWKEWRDMPFLRGGRRGGVMGLLLSIGVTGILLPYSIGREFVTSGFAFFLAVWGPLMMTMSLALDAFAGEKERHTLETLLASRLPDRAIMFGKIATIVCYAWGMSLIMLCVALVTVNVAFGKGQLLLYPKAVAIGAPLVGLLMSVLLSGVGVIVSIRAATVRQAAQTMSYLTLSVLLVPMLGMVLPREWTAHLLQWAARVGMPGIIAGVAWLLLAADVVVLGIAVSRFRRSRLILD